MTKKVKGMEIPDIGFGTWQIKGKNCIKSVESALEIGYRYIDTARLYGNEKEVGKGIRKSEVERDGIFLTTKIQPSNLDYQSVIDETNKSLKQLQMDYVDLLLVHWPNPSVPIEETMKAMHELKENGKVENIGVSNFTPELMENVLEVAPDITCNQVEMHPYLKQDKLLDFCQENDIILTAYSPLARGDVIEDGVLEKIGEKYGKSGAQVTLRWLLEKDNVVPIPKASNKEHRLENFQIFDFELSNEDKEMISGISKSSRKVDPGFSPW